MLEPVYTVGHSNHTVGHLLGLLRQHGVTALCDVRSTPYSRYSPQFDREALKASLDSVGIAYVFLGKELGARSDDPACYLYGKIQFSRLAETSLFQNGLGRIRDGMTKYRVVLMCAEKEPLECHRTILVARRLVESGLEVRHIHADGALEDHADALRRLARMLHLGEAEGHLFRTPEDLVSDAYLLQEKRIGYDSSVEAKVG